MINFPFTSQPTAAGDLKQHMLIKAGNIIKKRIKAHLAHKATGKHFFQILSAESPACLPLPVSNKKLHRTRIYYRYPRSEGYRYIMRKCSIKNKLHIRARIGKRYSTAICIFILVNISKHRLCLCAGTVTPFVISDLHLTLYFTASEKLRA